GEPEPGGDPDVSRRRALGTHEKQISNVFGWLLDTEGTHHLGDTFLRLFIEEVNRGLVGREPFEPAAYLDLQEEHL
ncbi:MAG TPA: PD-(D/E)XK nuclease family protein, partial [Nocardioidaceae bacterium]|nr:PD-(D/E)XK nuclease family protein [Nocardioidaceae bacterium]